MGMKRLTFDQVAALPVGTRIRVKWSGGNGPHWYKVGQGRWSKTICTEHDGQPLVVVDAITRTLCIGLEEPNTIVEVED
jgi:hypothetical protein